MPGESTERVSPHTSHDHIVSLLPYYQLVLRRSSGVTPLSFFHYFFKLYQPTLGLVLRTSSAAVHNLLPSPAEESSINLPR
jgi:hypothetical protein